MAELTKSDRGDDGDSVKYSAFLYYTAAALQLFVEMTQRLVQPDAITYVGWWLVAMQQCLIKQEGTILVEKIFFYWSEIGW